MKVVTPERMAEIEADAIKHGESDSDFMEEAGSGVALIVHDYAEKYGIDRTIVLLCGKGNNGGDAYVAGIHLLHLDYQVIAIQLNPIEECSPLCKQSYERFIHEGGQQVESITDFPSSGMIVDGIFGTGFKGKVGEPYSALITLANESGLPIIAVDIPSGLSGETGIVDGVSIEAAETAFLGLPKIGFFLNDAWNYLGKLRYVNFGIPDEYLDGVDSELEMLSADLLMPILPKIKHNRHKYEAGHVVGLAGSASMPGAALLSSSAALRSGAGIVRLFHPDGIQAEMSSSPYELIRIPFHLGDIQTVAVEMNKADAVFVGPGIGRTAEMQGFIKKLLPKIDKPCVIDADALFFLAEEDDIVLPKLTVLTPHMGEMMRLLGIQKKPAVNLDFLRVCQSYAKKRGVTLVLKGAPSFVFFADRPIRVNPTGDPGMATAGSGDVLTGLIASLLAQKVDPYDAASLGVYIHGLAGEHAAQDLTSYGLCASDLIFHFPEAFRFQTL